ncbi:MAG: PAS domain S-box protein [Candidatus Hodarchaeota archaeon]
MIRVLLVDDDGFYLSVAEELLADQDQDFALVTVNSTPEALRKLSEEPFDAIVADYLMPGMDGLVLLEKLRNAGNNIPFIIFTGQSREEVAIKALNLGADYYLKKEGEPLSQYQELAHIIRSAVRHRRTEEALRESEEKFRALADQSLVGILILHEGGIIYANDAVTSFFGYSREEMLAWPPGGFSQPLHPKDREFVMSQYRMKLAGETEVVDRYDFRVITKSGDVKWATVHSQRIQLKSGPALAASLIDATEFKSALEKLGQSEVRFKELANLLPQTVFELDLEGKATFVNQTGLEMFGYTKEDIDRGLNVFQLFISEDRERIEKNFRRKLRGEKLGEEGRHYIAVKKDGTAFPTLIYTNPIMEGNESIGLRGILLDDTDRVETELALRESEEKYRNLVERATDGILIIQGGRIKLANQQIVRMSGYSEEELIDAPFAKFIPQENREEFSGFYQRRMAGDNLPAIYETAVLRKDGTKLSIEVNAGVVSYLNQPADLIILRDITERKQAELALQESSERFETIFQNATDIMIIRELLDDGTLGSRLEVNEAACQRYGYSREEMLNSIPLDLRPPEEIERLNRLGFREQIRQGEPMAYETIHLAKDGTRIPVELHSRTVKLGEKKVRLAIIRDVSERKKAEKALKESEKQFRQIFEAIPEPASLWKRQEEDKIILAQVNRAAIEFTNGTVLESIGKDYKEIYASNPRGISILRRTMETGEPNLRVGISGAIPDGIERHFLIDCVKTAEDTVLAIQSDITDQKQAVGALRESEEKYRSLVEMSPDGISLTKLDGAILMTNQQGAKMLGFDDTEKVVGRNAFDFVAPEDQARAMEGLEKALTMGSIQNVEYTGLRKDGTTFAAAISATVIHDGEGKPKYFIGITRDATDRKRVEHQLRKSEERYRSILETMEEAYYEVDLAGNVIFFNEAFSTLFGYPPEEMLGRNYREGTDRVTAKKVYEAFNNVYLTGLPVKAFGWEIIRKDGIQRFVETSISRIIGPEGEPMGFRGIMRDVTDRKHADEALRESEQRHRELLEKMLEGVVVEDQDGCFTFANPRALEMLGYLEEELIGEHWSILVPKTEKGRVVEELAKRPRGISSTYETVLSKKDGQLVPVIIHASPLISTKKKFRGVLAVITDITERKQGEERLRQQREELSQFARAMAHDLRNGLHGIQGYAKLLAKKHDKSYTEKIANYVSKMNALLTRSVELADAGLVIEKTDAIDLNKLIRSVAEQVIPESISFHHDPLPTVVGDRVKVGQIFQNLFENAVTHAQPSNIALKRQDSEEGVGILVINDGKPIPPELRGDILLRSFTTKEQEGGVGLMIVQKLIEAHGWQIFLDDLPETTFRILIPSS